MVELADRLDLVWMALCTGLLLAFQAGLSCFGAGLVRAKNAVDMAVVGLANMAVAAPLFWLFGFGVLFGTGYLFDTAAQPRQVAFFAFHLGLAGAAASIVSGASAERLRFKAHLAVSAVVSGLLYPVIGRWTWEGGPAGAAGWLALRGFVDLGGATVVHLVGAAAALACVVVVGPRQGRFEPGQPAIRPHNLPLALLGTFLLWLGFLGITGGASGGVSAALPRTIANALLAALFGGGAGLLASRWFLARWDLVSGMQGLLAGLVAVSAACHAHASEVAMLVGAAGGLAAFGAARLLERWRVDDAVGAIAIHGAGGVLGTLSVAAADPPRLGTGLGHLAQLGAQLEGVAVSGGAAFLGAWALLSLLNRGLRLRVLEAQEKVGLSIAEHGATTEAVDLLMEMEAQRASADFTRPVPVEPHSEVGQIAEQYNLVLARVVLETERHRAALDAVERANRDLRVAEEKYRSIFENAVEGIFQITPSGRPLTANPMLARLYGFSSPEELLAALSSRGGLGFVSQARFHALVEEAIASARVEGFEAQIERADGSSAWLSINLRPVYGEQSALVCLEGTAQDVTRRKEQTELALARDKALEASRLKSEFLAKMSHELRTPMNAVIGLTDLLLDTELGEEQRELVDTVRRSGEVLLGIIEDVLDFSKIEAGRLDLEHVELDLRKLLEDTTAMLAPGAHAKGLDLVLSADPKLPRAVRGDPGRLRQILTNLLSNAIKFTERGHVELRVEVADEEAEELLVGFTVRDTGIGIPNTALPTLFESFVQVDASITRRYGGTGLGLTIARQLARLMGGDLTVSSRLGEGSCFGATVRFGRSAAGEDDESGAWRFHGREVWVLDDCAAVRGSLASLLAASGVVARCGEGVEALVSGSAPEQHPSLILLDATQPRGDWASAARALRARGLAGVPMVLLVPLGLRVDPAELFAADIRGQLEKPVHRRLLAWCLTEHLAPEQGPGTQRRRPVTNPAMGLPEVARPLRLLVAEDHPVNQKVARQMLERLGHEVVIAANGREAVDRAAREAYDAILMDIQMPEMDGYQATLRIREREGGGARVPIIAMTANATSGDRERCLACGMDDYLSKPVRRAELGAMLARWVGDAEEAWTSDLASEPQDSRPYASDQVIQPSSSSSR